MKKFLLIFFLVFAFPTYADDFWNHPDIRACCSEADALYADDYLILPDGSVKAKVTGGGPRNHAWASRFIGQEFHIEKEKVKTISGNPTGRPLLFMNSGGFIFCFIMGALG